MSTPTDDLLQPDIQDPAIPYTAYAESLAPTRLPPGRKNLWRDPQFMHATDGTYYDNVNVVATMEYDTRWVGDQAAFLDVTVASTNSTFGTPNAVGDAKRLLATVGETYSAGVRIIAATTAYANRAARLIIEFRNSSSAVVGTFLSEFMLVPTTSFGLLRLDAALAPSSTAFMTVRVKWWDAGDTNPGLGQTPLTAHDKFIISGLDVMTGVQLDTVYVDGEQRACSWDGTAHDSTSTRVVPVGQELPLSEQVPYGSFYRGFGGSMRFSAHVFRCNANNERLEDISWAFTSGSVVADEENEGSMWTFTGSFKTGITLDPYVDFVAPYIRLEYANGKIVDDGSGYGVQMGLYVVLPMHQEITATNTTYSLDTRDMLWLLNRRRYGGIETEDIGVEITTRMAQRLEALGFNRYLIQGSGRHTGRKRSYEMAEKASVVLNDLAKAIGYTNMTPDRIGRLTSFKNLDIQQREVNALYLLGDDNAVRSPYLADPQVEIYNHVIVYRDDKDNPFKASVQNRDERSPARVQRIGLQSMDPVNFSEAESQQDVDDKALQLLQEQSSTELRTTMKTVIEPWHNLHEVYYLHFRRSDGSDITEAYGRFSCTGFQIDFTQAGGSMTHKLLKRVPFDPTVGD
jgi:hypothetical protein